MKRLSWILTIPVTVVAVVFAVTNRASVTLILWPLGITITSPLFVVLLGSALVGLLIGGAVVWLSGAKARRRAHEARRRAAQLEREVARLQRERDPDATTLPAARG